MINYPNLEFNIPKLEALYLTMLVITIIASWFFQLTGSSSSSNANGFSSPRSHFLIFSQKMILKYKIEIIVCILMSLLILSIFISGSVDDTVIKLLDLTAFATGSVVMIKTVQEEKQARLEIEKINKRKTDFIADIFHRLKTPLTIIKIKIDSARISNRNQKLLPILQEASQYASDIATMSANIVSLSKIENGIDRLNKADIDFSQLVKRVTESFNIMMGSRKLDVEIEPDIHIFGDPDRLQEMILNLLDNSVKFTDPMKGVISVSLKCQSDSNEKPVVRQPVTRGRYRSRSLVVSDSLMKDEQQTTINDTGHQQWAARHLIVLTIFDNGSGIAQDQLPKLFDRHYQVEPKFGSAGIGLAIVKWIVDGHSGKIKIESEKNQGTKIHIIFLSNLSSHH